MYSRDEIKALTDKVLNMAKADAVEVSLRRRRAVGDALGELFDHRQPASSTTSSSRSPFATVQKVGTGVDARVRRRVAEGDGRRSAARRRRRRATTPNLHAARERPAGLRPRRRRRCRATADFGPGERAAWVKQSVDICEKKGVLGPATSRRPTRRPASRIPKGCSPTTSAAETGFVLTCRMASGSAARDGPASPARRSCRRSTSRELTESGREQGGEEPEAARDRAGPLHDDSSSRVRSARLLSTMMGAFNAGGGGRRIRRRRWRRRVQLRRHRPAVRRTPTARRRSVRSCSATASR